MTRRRARVRPVALTAVAPLALAAGCGDAQQNQSMLDPAGVGAQAVDGHWWTMLVIGVIVWVIVVGAMIAALARRRSSTASDRAGRRAPMVVLVAGAIIPAVIIVAVMAQSVIVTRSTDPGLAGDDARVVEVIGHRFWWEVRYPDADVVDANEIHIPAGERVRLEITSGDVIHSLWVPPLGGKVDMIPGRSNTMWLQTDTPGVYWGQCAEYCGVQHALMRFAVVVHEPQEYDGWLAARSRVGEPTPPTPPALPTPASPTPGGPTQRPQADLVAQGREVFMSSSCVYCHAVAGTEARGTFGPDLTHLASRQSLAAGILPNNRGNLAGWILDPQSIKPGNEMPGTDLSGPDLQALLNYLESLE